MKNYAITAIKRKAERLGVSGLEYLADCQALADEWNEPEDSAIFTDEALAEIKATWSQSTALQSTVKQNRKPCKNCGGL